MADDDRKGRRLGDETKGRIADLAAGWTVDGDSPPLPAPPREPRKKQKTVPPPPPGSTARREMEGELDEVRAARLAPPARPAPPTVPPPLPPSRPKTGAAPLGKRREPLDMSGLPASERTQENRGAIGSKHDASLTANAASGTIGGDTPAPIFDRAAIAAGQKGALASEKVKPAGTGASQAVPVAAPARASGPNASQAVPVTTPARANRATGPNASQAVPVAAPARASGPNASQAGRGTGPNASQAVKTAAPNAIADLPSAKLGIASDQPVPAPFWPAPSGKADASLATKLGDPSRSTAAALDDARKLRSTGSQRVSPTAFDDTRVAANAEPDDSGVLVVAAKPGARPVAIDDDSGVLLPVGKPAPAARPAARSAPPAPRSEFDESQETKVREPSSALLDVLAADYEKEGEPDALDGFDEPEDEPDALDGFDEDDDVDEPAAPTQDDDEEDFGLDPEEAPLDLSPPVAKAAARPAAITRSPEPRAPIAPTPRPAPIAPAPIAKLAEPQAPIAKPAPAQPEPPRADPTFDDVDEADADVAELGAERPDPTLGERLDATAASSPAVRAPGGTLRPVASLRRKRGFAGDLRYVATVGFGVRAARRELAALDVKQTSRQASRRHHLVTLGRAAANNTDVEHPRLPAARKDLAAIEAERQRQTDEVGAADAELAKVRKAREDAAKAHAAALAELDGELTALTGKLAPLDKDALKIKRRATNLAESLRDLDTKIAKAERTAASGNPKVDVAAVQAEIASLKADRKAIQADEPVIAGELDALAPQIAALEASRAEQRRKRVELVEDETRDQARVADVLAAIGARRKVVDRAAADAEARRDRVLFALGERLAVDRPDGVLSELSPVDAIDVDLGEADRRIMELREILGSVDRWKLTRGIVYLTLLLAVLGGIAYGVLYLTR